MKQDKSCYYSLLLFLLILSITSTKLFAQPFKLTNIYSNQFSLDRLNQQVYFKDYLTDTVRTVDLKTMDVTKTKFLYYPPVISNKSNYVVYVDTLYDLDNNLQYPFIANTDTLLISHNSSFQGSFSPNDEIFMFGNPKYYFPLDDLSSLKPKVTGLGLSGGVDYGIWPQWSSDSSFIFKSGDTVMVEFFLKSKRLDTLTIAENTIMGWAYNSEHDILAYSVVRDLEKLTRIYFHYDDSDNDSLVFSPERDDSANISIWNLGAVAITSLSWSPDYKKLAFLGFQYIDISMAEVYIYSLDSNRTYKYGEDDIYYGGRKYSLDWANNDTLIYLDATDMHLYGLDVSSVITSVEDCGEENSLSNRINISNYPNPFNGTTRISISLPDNTEGHLGIYDILGRLVKEYHIAENSNSTEIIWDGKNDHNQTVASGVYFGVVKAEDSNIKGTKTVKMIYLK